MTQRCFIGVDGGGTKTVGVALDEQGHVLCRAEAKSINYCSVGMDEAILALRTLVNELSEKAKLPVAALAVGSSALDERIRDRLYDKFLERISADPILSAIPDRIVKSDAYMALLAACEDERGAILIAGTGVMGLAADRGKLHSVAGWGDVFGDRGSGYWIAQTALCRALDYADGLSSEGEALFLAMCEFFSLSSAAELIAQVYAPDFDKSQLAAFSACVDALAARGDDCSGRILDAAADELFAYCRSLATYLGKKTFTLGFYGSVLLNNKRIFKRLSDRISSELPQAQIKLPQTTAENAAARYAIRRMNA
ncbi:MAG: hypothetical protein II328_02670 [Clostridia bacterium]|nr:hypothetical protein [Clostridia bacterium]